MKHLLASTALASVLCSGSVYAQVAVPVAAQPQPEELAIVLDEIVVTAQRREETLQDAAIAVNAATGEELVQLGITDASQLSRIAPALSVTT